MLENISRNSSVRDLLGTWAVAWTVAQIIAVIAIFAAYPNAWTFFLAFLIVGIRQHSLILLSHETWHHSLFHSRRVNQWVGAWICAYPLMVRRDALRRRHLNHHQSVGRGNDPDRHYWMYTTDERWPLFRRCLYILSGLFFVSFVAGGFLRSLLGLPTPPNDAPDGVRQPFPHDPPSATTNKRETLLIGVAQLSLLLAFTATIGWPWYFALWLGPVVTIFPFLNQFRAWAEHRNGRLLVYRAGLVERFLLAPYNFHLHAYHHLYPAEPWYRLPTLKLRIEEQHADVIEYGSYVGEFLAFMRGRNRYPEWQDDVRTWGKPGNTNAD